jgi:hypothetical protein
MIQIVGDLVVGIENCNGVVPSGFEPGEKGAVSDFIVVLGPVFVVLRWLSGFGLVWNEIVAKGVLREANDGMGAMVNRMECGRGKGNEEHILSFISVLVQSILIRFVESHIDRL